MTDTTDITPTDLHKACVNAFAQQQYAKARQLLDKLSTRTDIGDLEPFPYVIHTEHTPGYQTVINDRIREFNGRVRFLSMHSKR